jgi:dimethylglycine dehydrogenase
MLNKDGHLIGDLTVGCIPPSPGQAEGPFGTIVGGSTSNTAVHESFYLFGSGIAERYYERHFDQTLTAWTGEPCSYSTRGYELSGLSIAGPKSRELLQRCVGTDVSNEAFPFMNFRSFEVGLAPALIGRLTFTGDLGYELWMPASYQRYLFDLLIDAGKDLGITPFGSSALNSLRLEKSFGSWGREYRPIYDPFEAGLDRFIVDNRSFIGAEALAAKHPDAAKKTLRTWTVDVADDNQAADVLGDEPIWLGETVVGWVTSGGYAHNSASSVAMGYVPADLADSTEPWQIEILGIRRSATLLSEPLLDPLGERMRG